MINPQPALPGFEIHRLDIRDITDVSILEIQNTVANFYNFNPREMRSQRRTRTIARPRQIAMYLSRELTNCSFPAIGRRFHRDHTTIIYGCSVIDRLLKDDADMQCQIDALFRRLVG